MRSVIPRESSRFFARRRLGSHFIARLPSHLASQRLCDVLDVVALSGFHAWTRPTSARSMTPSSSRR